MSNKDDNSLGWFKSEVEKQNYINRLEKKKEARENEKREERVRGRGTVGRRLREGQSQATSSTCNKNPFVF